MAPGSSGEVSGSRERMPERREGLPNPRNRARKPGRGFRKAWSGVREARAELRKARRRVLVPRRAFPGTLLYSGMLRRPLLALLLTALPLQAQDTGFVDVPGGRLHYEARGHGPALVLIHDGLVFSATWDGQMPAFSRHYRTVRYDRRGYGLSDPPKEAWSDLDDLHAVLDALKIDRAVLVGNSNGSRLAVDFALAHPERVSGLVLVGPVVTGLPYSEHFVRRGTENYRPLFLEGSREKLIEAWIQDRYITDPANTRARERIRELLRKSPGPLGQDWPEPRDPDPAVGRLSGIRVPTLIVVGASDIPDVHAHAGALEAGIHGSRRVLVADAGHLVHLEKPERFNETVMTFLKPDLAAQAWLDSLRNDRTFEESRSLFDYDASAPPDVRETGTEMRGGARVIDLTYASPMGGRVPAWLVRPAAEGRHPAAVFLHPGQGDRSTFLDEAVALAERGLVSLLIGAPFTRPERQGIARKPFDPVEDRRDQIQTIVDLRRAFDVLAARPEVDAGRLAYVGHSLGATVGGTLAGIERRPRAFVLMAGLPSLTYGSAHGDNPVAVAFQTLLTPEEQGAWLRALAPLDAVHYVSRSAPAKLLFQFARRDEFISPWDAEVYVRAAGEPKEVRWYDTDHSFDEQARRDRMEWLLRML